MKDLEIKRFKNLFRGREDVYPRMFVSKAGKKGYSPVCKNRFKNDCDNRCYKCTNADYALFTEDVIKRHLKGFEVTGIYPLLPDETSYFIAADFDNHTGNNDPLKDTKEFFEVCQLQEIPCYIERSRSGKGYHAWIFFDSKIPAWKSRLVMFALLKEAQAVDEETSLKSFDRLFPNQDKLSGKGFGNLIALPLQGKALQKSNTTFLDMANGCNPYPNQWDFLSTVQKVSEVKLDQLIKEWDLKKEDHRLTNTEVSTEINKEGLEKVLKCNFIKHCKDNAETLREPLWYALVSNLARFKNGAETIHEYSKNYSTYSPEETDRKIAQALRNTNPHTCRHIRENGFKCPKNCEVKAPAGLAYKKTSTGVGSEYVLNDDCLSKVESKNNKREVIKLCNFNLQLTTDKLIDDGLEQERWFAGIIKVAGDTKPFLIRGRDFANNGRLQEAISEQGGASCQFLQRYIPDIRLAVQKLSPIKEEKILKQFGWIDNENYISPSTIITKDGLLPQTDLKVDLSSAENARYLDIKIIDDDTHKQVLRHIVNDLLSLNGSAITYPTIGHTFASPLIQFLSDGSRYILWLRGLTGRGKSFLARRVQQFFGNFEEKHFVSWTSTMNFVQMVGFYFKDAVFLADDFKSGHITDKRELIQKIQSYADNAGRGRLNPDSTTKQTRPIRGFMISTGEDIPVNEASTLARMLVIDFPKNEKYLENGHRCLENQKHYSGVMGRYIHWLLRSKRLENIKRMEIEHQQYFYKDISGQQNDSRISHNLAINMMGFECFCDFISDVEGGVIDHFDTRAMIEEHKEILKDLRDKSLTLVKDEQASNIFLGTLIDLINSGRVSIQDIVSGDDTKNMVGFKKEGKVYIIPTLAFQEVQRVLRDSGNQLNFSMKEIGSQLLGDGLIIEHEPNRSTKLVWWNGKSYRVFVFPAGVFGEEDE